MENKTCMNCNNSSYNNNGIRCTKKCIDFLDWEYVKYKGYPEGFTCPDCNQALSECICLLEILNKPKGSNLEPSYYGDPENKDDLIARPKR